MLSCRLFGILKQSMKPAAKSRNARNPELKPRTLATNAGNRFRRRRRRRPEDAQSEILAAAEAFLRFHPFNAMTVDDLMSRTGLSRPSFYEYFNDCLDFVIKLVEKLCIKTFSLIADWL